MAHIQRLLGDRPIKTLTPLDIQNVYTQLLDEGKAPATVRHVRVIIHGAFQDAVTWDLVSKDPARGTKAPKPSRPVLKIPTVEEARTFLQTAESHRLYALWAFLAMTGCRRGEALALQWSDIDWDRRVVTIQRTQSGWGTKRVANPPKTPSGRRVVALSDYVLEVLGKHREEQNIEQGAAGSEWNDGGWVFTTRHGTWLAGGHVYDSFKRLSEQAGLPGTVRPHDLRHAMASYWLAKGIPVKVVSERLGHANIAITLEIYGHLLPNMQADAAEKMDALFFESEPKRAADGPQKLSKTSKHRGTIRGAGCE
jgi:integrase